MAPRRGEQISVEFTGFHRGVPPLAMRAASLGADRCEGFREQVRRHALRHMITNRAELVRVEGSPDSPTGRVVVNDGSAEGAVAGHFTVSVTAPAAPAPPAGVPWVGITIAIVIAVILFA